jgi:hypothetical protein
MKAICVKNSKEIKSATFFKGESRLIKYDLTIGKVYEILLLPELAPNILPKKWQVIDDLRKNVHTPFDFFKPIADRTMAAIQPITYSGARNQEKMNDVAANTIPLMPPATPKLFSFACVMISLEICEWCRSATKSYQLLRYLSAKRYE